MRRRELEHTQAVRRRLRELSVEFERPDDPVDFLADEPEDPPSGLPAGLAAFGEVIRHPTPKPLPAVVKPPGRHAVRTRSTPSAWLEDRVPAVVLERARWSPMHSVAVLAVVAVAVAVAGWVALRSGGASTTVPTRLVAGSASTALPAVPGVASPATAPARSGSAARVVVDVAGKVRHPGVVTLPAGARVQDAIAKAGGARSGVSLTSLNLARVLVDGEQILVGTIASAPAQAASGGTAAATGGAVVNINSAGLGELDTLPGVGPVTAQKILDWRSAHGRFSAVDELLEVDGIGEKTLADIAPHVTV